MWKRRKKAAIMLDYPIGAGGVDGVGGVGAKTVSAAGVKADAAAGVKGDKEAESDSSDEENRGTPKAKALKNPVKCDAVIIPECPPS